MEADWGSGETKLGDKAAAAVKAAIKKGDKSGKQKTAAAKSFSIRSSVAKSKDPHS